MTRSKEMSTKLVLGSALIRNANPDVGLWSLVFGLWSLVFGL
jgi:hypothetical protein